jgi:hypothetical protein
MLAGLLMPADLLLAARRVRRIVAQRRVRCSPISTCCLPRHPLQRAAHRRGRGGDCRATGSRPRQSGHVLPADQLYRPACSGCACAGDTPPPIGVQMIAPAWAEARLMPPPIISTVPESPAPAPSLDPPHEPIRHARPTFRPFRKGHHDPHRSAGRGDDIPDHGLYHSGQPAILGLAGMPVASVAAATCFAAGFASILMGTIANRRWRWAGMGLNAYFSFTVVMMHVPGRCAGLCVRAVFS